MLDVYILDHLCLDTDGEQFYSSLKWLDFFNKPGDKHSHANILLHIIKK